MKVAYVYYLVTPKQIGVERKIRQQARAIRDAGLDSLDIIALNPSKEEVDCSLRFVRFNSVGRPWRNYDYIIRRYRLIERSIDLGRYDHVILRYPLSDGTGPDFTQKYSVFSEHNTDEPSELRSRMTARASLVEKAFRRVMLFLEERYARPTLRGCRGLIGVTAEICELEKTRAGRDIPAVTIANGIDVESIPLTGFMPFDGRHLHLVLLSSSLRPWHGLERVINSISGYRGSVQITLHLVGDIRPEELSQMAAGDCDIRFHGQKTGDELDAVMSGMNLAISTMALYRKNMQEACSLKTREYTARGIPFLLAYGDPDLQGVDESHRFCLTFANDGSRLEMDRVLQFSQDMSARPEELSVSMREYALKYMDWRGKMRRYLDFVAEVAAGQARH